MVYELLTSAGFVFGADFVSSPAFVSELDKQLLENTTVLIIKVFTAAKIHIVVLWLVTPCCSLLDGERSGCHGMYTPNFGHIGQLVQKLKWRRKHT